MKILILEDDNNRIVKFRDKLSRHALLFVNSAADAIKLLLNEGETFDMIFLDHDLGGEVYVDSSNTNTGSEVVRWLISDQDRIMIQPYIIIHSLNYPAAQEMQLNLTNYGYKYVYRIPYTKLVSDYLDDPHFLEV